MLSIFLNRIAYLALVPGLLAAAVTVIGAQAHWTAEWVRWCVTWWWFVLVAGVCAFIAIRAVAWLLRKVASA